MGRTHPLIPQSIRPEDTQHSPLNVRHRYRRRAPAESRTRLDPVHKRTIPITTMSLQTKPETRGFAATRFTASIERRVLNYIRKYGVITAGERVVVAISADRTPRLFSSSSRGWHEAPVRRHGRALRPPASY